MKPIPFIRASPALHVARFLRRIGAPTDAFWERIGLPRQEVVEPELLVPFYLVVDFVEAAARREGIPDLGLRVAEESGLGAAGRFGNRTLGARTLLAALTVACESVGTHNSGARYWIVPEGDSVRVCRRLRCPDPAFRQTDLLTVSLMTQLVRRAAGEQWLPLRVELQSTDRERIVPRDVVESLSGGVVEEGRPATSITIPRALLARSIAPPRLDADPAASARETQSPPRDFLASLELLVEETLASERLDVAVMARAAGLSVRSLQRRLTKLGVTYTDVVDRVRFEKAMAWLRDGGAKIIDVAFALGYSDPAHFTRAFRRWTSMTPAEYRSLQVGGSLAGVRATSRIGGDATAWAAVGSATER